MVVYKSQRRGGQVTIRGRKIVEKILGYRNRVEMM